MIEAYSGDENLKTKEFENKPITDTEIKEANDLYRRIRSKENPLSEEENNRLNSLTKRREQEVDILCPKFNYAVIYGLKGTPEEASRQYEVATDYYEKIIELGSKEGGLKEFALRLEKLGNWSTDPGKIEKIFVNTINSRKKLYKDVFDKMNEVGKGKNFEEPKARINFYKRVNSGVRISDEEINYFEKAIKKHRMAIAADVPEYRRKAVIYHPSKAGEWLNDLKNCYINSNKLKNISERTKRHRKKIEEFEAIKEKLRPKLF